MTPTTNFVLQIIMTRKPRAAAAAADNIAVDGAARKGSVPMK